jgi:hypothetical protein
VPERELFLLSQVTSSLQNVVAPWATFLRRSAAEEVCDQEGKLPVVAICQSMSMISPPLGVTMPQNTVGLIVGLRMRTLPSPIATCNPRRELAFGKRGSHS